MTNSYKLIYAPAAEVVGMIMAYLSDKEKETDGQFHSNVESIMVKVKAENFITCVHHMNKHYPPIADK